MRLRRPTWALRLEAAALALAAACAASGRGGVAHRPTPAPQAGAQASAQPASPDAPLAASSSPTGPARRAGEPARASALRRSSSTSSSSPSSPLPVSSDGCLAPAHLEPASPPPPGEPPCPNPKTCGFYRLQQGNGGPISWPQDPDGRVRIRFWINPWWIAPDARFSPEEAEAAILTAASVWAAADPRLCFLYQGRTTRVPASGDGYSDFTIAGLATTRTGSDGCTIVEGDISDDTRAVPLPMDDSVWARCQQRDGSCSYEGPRDIQALMAHEIGHVLGLHHSDPDGAAWVGTPPPYYKLTMYKAPGSSGSTLGLGDVLGLRALYPCDCPLPPIYDP